MGNPGRRNCLRGMGALALTLALLTFLAAPVPAAPLATTPAPTPHGTGSPPPAPAPGLTALDVPAEALPLLDRLGIAHQGQPRAGVIRAAADAGQRAALEKEGVAYTARGNVAILEQRAQPEERGRAAAVACIAESYPNYPIPKLDWCRLPIYSYCPEAAGATVDWVDIHYIIDNVYADLTPGGLGLYEIAVNLGATDPAWDYVNLEAKDYCAPSSPPKYHAAGLVTYDHWIFNVDATLGTSVFYGRPVNQHWDLSCQHYCTYSPQATVAYWGLWIYYTPLPTATPTRTATPTVTRTPSKTATRTRTPTPRPSATWPPGMKPRFWLPLALRSH